MYLSGGLGVAFADLQRGGRNLRLYVNYGPGTPEATDPVSHGCTGTGAGDACNPTGNLYSTGHYDISLPGGPCSQADPKAFTTFANLMNYAAARGELLQQVDYNDVASLCAAQAPAIPPPIINVTGVPVAIPGAPYGTPPPIRTPSPVPTFVPIPAGPPVDLGPPVGPGPIAPDMRSMLPYIALAVGALLLLR